MAYKAGEVARLAHVGVRTLHHYDAIGLLEPSGRSEAGYRLYTAQDLERLQHVLFNREIGFGLEAMLGLIDKTLAAQEEGIPMGQEEMFEVFGDFDPSEHEDEGVAPGDARAMDAVEHHRQLIDAWFYPCSHQMHVHLGRMYVADPRFTATYEGIHPGMARYVCDAIAANAGRAAEEPR